MPCPLSRRVAMRERLSRRHVCLLSRLEGLTQVLLRWSPWFPSFLQLLPQDEAQIGCGLAGAVEVKKDLDRQTN
eukprot:3830534-Amphidinium_carterae.2